MEKILNFLWENINLSLFTNFSIETICFIGIIINILLYLFFANKHQLAKTSNIVTCTILSLNSFLLLGIFIKNKIILNEFNFGFLGNIFILNNENILSKFFIYIFFILFILITRKITKKARFAVALMNSCLLLLAITSGLLLQVENALLTFMLLDLSVFFMYKYASNMRLRKPNPYSVSFIILNIFSSILFYTFFSLLFIAQGQSQIAIIQICCAFALLLKAGLFPVYNYTIIKNIKNNLPFSILIYSYLPFLAIISFLKFSNNIGFSSEVCFICTTIFLLLLIFTGSICAYKSKNLIKFFANYSLSYCAFYIFSSVVLQNYQIGFFGGLTLIYLLLCAYSMLCILKINFKSQKITIQSIEGLFAKNKMFVNIFALTLLLLANIIPSLFCANNLELVKRIYEFDKFGIYACAIFVFSNTLIMLNAFKIIKTSFTRKYSYEKLTKRTTLLYVVPIVLITLLILGIFLQILNFNFI